MLQIMNQILTQGGFLRAFFQTVILIAAGCALFRADILGPGDKHALTTVVWKLAVPCMAFDAFMSDFNTQEFLSELGVLALSFVLYGALYALGTLLFRRAAGQGRKGLRSVLRCRAADALFHACFAVHLCRDWLHGPDLRQRHDHIRMVLAPAFALGAVCAVQASGLARFTTSEMVAVTMGFAAPASATLGLFCIQYRRCERFASTVCFLSTVLCLVTIPLVYALTQLAAASGLF